MRKNKQIVPSSKKAKKQKKNKNNDFTLIGRIAIFI